MSANRLFRPRRGRELLLAVPLINR
jgi:hypothetical protein